MKRPEQDMIARSIAARLEGKMLSVYWCENCGTLWECRDEVARLMEICTCQCGECDTDLHNDPRMRDLIWKHPTNKRWENGVSIYA